MVSLAAWFLFPEGNGKERALCAGKSGGDAQKERKQGQGAKTLLLRCTLQVRYRAASPYSS